MINQKEKKYMYTIFGIIIVIMIIVLIMIWMPMFKGKEKSINSIKKYNESYNENMINEYKNVILKYINVDNYSELKNFLDKDYLEKNNLDINNAKNFLENEGLIMHPTNSTIVYNSGFITNGKENIFSYTYKIADRERKIHVIESYYKKYSISFEQDGYPIMNKDGYNVKYNDLTFTLIPIKSYDNSIVFELSITNNSTEEYIFDFSSNNDADVIINNNLKSYLTSVVIGNETSSIVSLPNSNIKTVLSFNVNIENQSNITGIEFNNVTKSDGSKTNMNLLFI